MVLFSVFVFFGILGPVAMGLQKMSVEEAEEPLPKLQASSLLYHSTSRTKAWASISQVVGEGTSMGKDDSLRHLSHWEKGSDVHVLLLHICTQSKSEYVFNIFLPS